MSILFYNQNYKNSKKSKLLFSFYGQFGIIDTKKISSSCLVHVIKEKILGLSLNNDSLVYCN